MCSRECCKRCFLYHQHLFLDYITCVDIWARYAWFVQYADDFLEILLFNVLACKKTELDVTKWHNVTEVRVKQKRNEKLDPEKPSSIPNLEGTRTSVTSVSNSNRSGRVGVAKAYTSDLIKCIYQIAGEPSRLHCVMRCMVQIELTHDVALKSTRRACPTVSLNTLKTMTDKKQAWVHVVCGRTQSILMAYVSSIHS